MTHRLAVIGGSALTVCGVLSCAGKAGDASSSNGGSDARAGQGGSSSVMVASAGRSIANAGRGGDAESEASSGASSGGHAEVAASGRGGSAGQAGASALAGSGGQGNVSAPLTTSAWDVTVSATWVLPNSHSDLPKFDLTLVLLDQPMFRGLISAEGSVGEFGVVRKSVSSVSISSVLVGLPEPGPLTALTVQTMTLSAFDDDGDGFADRLVGAGDGTIEESCGDCSLSNPVKLSLSGRLDRTPPRLDMPSAPLNPIDSASMLTTEVLKSATVSLSGTKSVSLAVYNSSTRVIAVQSDQVLPFSGAWQVIGAGWDFADNALDLSGATLSTIADPGVFIQDGFESALNAALTGRAAVVDASSGLPIPGGQQALLLPPGSSATFHLKAASTSSKVSARFVDLSDGDSNGPWVRLKAGVIGGSRRAEDFSSFLSGTLSTTHAVWKKAAPVRSAQVPLLDAGTDVVVRISAELCTAGPCPLPGALLVDDLKIE